MYAMADREIYSVINVVDSLAHEMSMRIQEAQMYVVCNTDMTPAARVESVLQLQAAMLRVQRGIYAQTNGLAKLTKQAD